MILTSGAEAGNQARECTVPGWMCEVKGTCTGHCSMSRTRGSQQEDERKQRRIEWEAANLVARTPADEGEAGR